MKATQDRCKGCNTYTNVLRQYCAKCAANNYLLEKKKNKPTK